MATARTLLVAVAAFAVAAVPGLPERQPDLGDLGDLAGSCVTADGDVTDLVGDRVTTPPAHRTVAGLDVAVVTDPIVPPGIPTALFDTGAGLCTVDAFNLAVAPGLDGAARTASAFASTAAMPWLGEVEVAGVAVDGDTVTLTTLGGRHAVVADWTLRLDELGIRSATFTTRAWGVGLEIDDIHALEGITSRPGHARTWTRDAAGLLHVDMTVDDQLQAATRDRDAAAANAAARAGLAPGDLLEGELDGQVVRFTLGFAAPLVEAPPVGAPEDDLVADRLLYVKEGMDRVYDQYEGWGTPDVWAGDARTFLGVGTVPDEVGYVNYNSPLAAVCLACAVLGDFIEIHMDLFFAETTEEVLIGVDYPHNNSYTLEVVGHEFTHAVQGGYGDGNVGLTNAFYEGTATASQSLYHEAENSAQRGSIEFLDNANGCEGYENDRGGWIEAQAAGPFLDGHTYDTCYLWWSYLAEHGGEGLVDLMEALPSLQGETIERHLQQLDLAAADGDGTTDLARWAAAYTAGTDADGYAIEDGSGDVHDWFALLDQAERARDLAPGASHAVTVAAGGTAGFRVTGTGTVVDLPNGAEASVWRVVDGSLELVGGASVGTSVTAGDILVVVAPDGAEHTGSVALG